MPATAPLAPRAHEVTRPVAAIDCGTNSTRMLVVDPAGKTLSRTMTITRLGKDVDATGRIDEEALRRTVRVLLAMREEMDLFGVEKARLVATSACRDAGNRDEFLAAASDAVGVEAEMLSGEDEGRLAFAGATAGFYEERDEHIVVDIGGGSTELIFQREGLVSAVSMPLGCVRLTERYLRHDPPTKHEIDDVRRSIEQTVDNAITAAFSSPPRGSLIGLAGTVSTLAALEQQLSVYDHDRIHHFVLTMNMVLTWLDRLSSEPARERLHHPGMTPGREDVIVGGVLVLAVLMSRLNADTCLVSEADILDGIVGELLGFGGG